ncbi:MAG: WD40 repeat protein, partial [Planctomycetaceae bacterium]
KCYQNVRPEHVKETRSQAVLTLLWPRSQDELATYEVVAVDHDGQRHAVVGTAGPTNRREFTFPIALARISHFEYRLRPYRHVVTFENVSMETRFLTDLLVKTVSLPAPVLDAGETPSTAEVRHPEKRDQLPAQVGPGHRLEHVVWSHDSLQAFGTGDFNTLVSWQQNESEWVPTSIQMSHHANSITVSSKSPLVVVGTNVGTAEVWDATTQERQCELRSSPQWSVYAVAISADEKLVAACGTDGTVAVFDRVSKELIVRLGEKAETRMSSLAFSPDGTTLAAMDRYGVLVLWSVPQGERLAEWKNVGGESHSVYWSRDGRQVAVNGWGKVTLIAAEMGSVPRDVTAPDEAVTKSPELDDSGLRRSGIKFGGFTYASLTAIPSDIRMAASIAPDASLLIWDLATRKIVQTLPAPAADVISKDSAGNGLRNLVFSPDGQRVACTTIRGDVVFWQLAQAEAPQGQNDAGIPVEPTAVASATAPSARLNIKYDMPGAEAETRLFVERIDPAFYAEHGRRDEYGPEEYGGIRFSRLKNGDSLALENLRAGTYVVARYRLVDIVREGTGKASSSVYLDGQWIELGEKETKSVSVSRPSGQAISGRVVVPADLKLNTLVVHVCSRNAHTSGSLNHRDVLHFDALNPDSDHTFKTEELIPGQYKVIVDGYANHSLAVSGIILPSWAGTAHVTVPASGKPPAIEVTLRDFDRDEWLKDQRAEQEKTRTLREPAFVLPDHLNVMAVGFGGDGKELVSVATERAVTIRTWDVVEQKLKREVKLDSDRHGNFFLTGRLQLSADGRRVAAIVSGQVGVWDAVTGKLVNMLELPEELEHGFLRGLTITPDLSLIAVGRTPGLSGFSPPHAHGIVWDVASGKVLQTVQHDNAVQVQSIALSHDGKWLATGGQQAGTFVWEVSTGKRLVALPNENPDRTHPDPEIKEPVASQVLCLAFSPNDRRLAIGDMLGVKLVDAASGRLEHRLDAPFRLGRSGLVFSQDGQLLARTATDEVVPIWSTKTGRLVAEIHSEAHDGAFSDDGRWFATGFTDKQKGLAVWQLRDDPLAAANDGNANDGPEGTLDTEADDVVVSWVQRGSVKFGGIEPRTLLVIRKDGSAIVPANHRERESRTKLRQDDVANLLKQLVDDCDIESIEGLWFNGKPNFWSGSQDTLFVRRGDRTIRLTCEYGWPSGTEQTDLKIQNFTAASRVVGHFKSLIRAGGRDAVAKALPIANRSLQQHFPKVELLTVDDFRWGENFPDGHRRLTFHRERQVQGEPENVRVEVLVPDEGESRPGDVTVNKQRVQPVAVNVKPADGNSRPPVTQTLQPAVPASEVFSEVVELLSADDLAVKDVSDINDPDVLLDQLEKGPRVSHFLMTGGGIFWQPGTPPQAMYVTLWNQRFASGKQVDPRVRQLINLGEAARSKVQQRLLKAKPQVASHLALVLRSTGNAESIPVLIQLLKRLSQQTGATRGGSSTNTSFVLTSALWKLTGRRHSFTPEQWEQWWNGVRQDFSVARDRQTPEFKSLVTAERVRQIVSQLSDQEVSARNRLIELGPAAVEHLIATLKGELTQHPDDADSKPGEARSLSMRLAWVIDELGATKRQAPSSSRTAGK